VSLPGMERATAQRLVEAAHQCVRIREQRTGTSPSKRRWSEVSRMRAE
jgi:hypothetical protein